MRIDTAIEYADQLLYERTGKHLSDLQSCIIQQSWQGRTYGQVASSAGYSEGHIKDVAAQLWQLLSEALGERITKGNLRSRLINRVKRTLKKAAPDTYESIASVARPMLAPLGHQSTYLGHSVEPVGTPAKGNSVEPAHFLGRDQAVRSLQTLFQTHRLIVIQGEGGLGKTTLARQYAQRFEQVLELLMAKEAANITPVESVVEEWLRQNFNEEPGREFGVTLSRLKRHLQAQPMGKVGIVLDNLEPALDRNGQFIAGHRHYVELLRMLAQTPANVMMTSRDRLCEPGLAVHHYRLLGLGLEAWQQFFQARQVPVQAADQSVVLSEMHHAYGGNAKAMEILCAAVIGDFDGDLLAYWQENRSDLLATADLRNLVVSQVNRLQQLDSDAYKVFCRLGCYRYQDQPRLKSAAILALMWDIEPSSQRQILNALRDRSLLEFCKGEYWLHPVSRAEAIARLRQSPDWQPANQAAARHWQNSVTQILSLPDGLQALEAYYHYIAAQAYSAAAAVLLQSRHNQWRQFLPLASSLYRMGLLQPVIKAITQVLPLIEPQGHSKYIKLRHSELNNILGDVYWITGQIHSAIACQQQTLADTCESSCLSATRDLELETVVESNLESSLEKGVEKDVEKNAYYLKMLTVDARLSIGLYCIDLWELAQAAEQFEQVIALAADTAHQAWADKATVGLAVVHAYLGDRSAATTLANSIYLQITNGPADEHGRYAYFLQLLGQAFTSLGELEKAQGLYEKAIAFAEVAHYVQVKAKALTGLAILQRQRGQYFSDGISQGLNRGICNQGALALHTEAVALCEAIGAKCDLAEAYFQFGLSAWQAAKGGDLSEVDSEFVKVGAIANYFERAHALFLAIRAPQQMQRVRQKQTELGISLSRKKSVACGY